MHFEIVERVEEAAELPLRAGGIAGDGKIYAIDVVIQIVALDLDPQAVPEAIADAGGQAEAGVETL
jgi:hypothetical protein